MEVGELVELVVLRIILILRVSGRGNKPHLVFLKRRRVAADGRTFALTMIAVGEINNENVFACKRARRHGLATRFSQCELWVAGILLRESETGSQTKKEEETYFHDG